MKRGIVIEEGLVSYIMGGQIVRSAKLHVKIMETTSLERRLEGRLISRLEKEGRRDWWARMGILFAAVANETKSEPGCTSWAK
jgi:hypothetical protein